ncbi:MAG: murein biosynthesis integral membrane protein MurJ, partial [Candidatus Omnitrophica bacterium]|nr:murein biosynthesis integral membrane protein MurJ [Candidatus Omnitrophota bacterium]
MSLFRSAGKIGLATAFSRVLGFVRDMTVAAFFGTSLGAQAFVVAFRLPNFLREIVGEGATHSAVVPVLSEPLAQGDTSSFWEIVCVLWRVALVVLLLLAVAGVLLAPVLVGAVAPGFLSDPEKYALTVRLARWLFPYICLIGMTAI